MIFISVVPKSAKMQFPNVTEGLARMLGSWCARLAARAPRAKQQPTRAFWWGHDTIEDKEARAKADKEKGIISWTDPNKDIEEKKEFTWAPARIEQEAMVLCCDVEIYT